MTYGLEVFDASGRKLLSSITDAGSVFLEDLSILWSSASGSKTYTGTDITNRDLMVVQHGFGAHTWTVDRDVNGNPRINWTRRTFVRLSADTQVSVYVR